MKILQEGFSIYIASLLRQRKASLTPAVFNVILLLLLW